MGTVKYRKTKVKLSFFDDKPTRFKIQKVTLPVLKADDVVTYIANSAAIPRSTVRAAVEAISEAIVYFTINGHRVKFDRLGSFGLKVKSKAVQTAKECDLSTLRRINIQFTPGGELAKLVKEVTVTSASGAL